MIIELWAIGKTSFSFVDEGEQVFVKRLKNYTKFDVKVLQSPKKKSKVSSEIKRNEAILILNKLDTTDFLVLLDEKGKEHSSRTFSGWIEKLQVTGKRKLVFLIGGAFGFDASVYERSNAKVSLSKMTYSHQLIRLIFLEQLFRAFTIIRNEPYHND